MQVEACMEAMKSDKVKEALREVSLNLSSDCAMYTIVNSLPSHVAQPNR